MKFTRSTISQLFAMVALAASGAAFASGTHAGGHGDGGETAIGKPGVAAKASRTITIEMSDNIVALFVEMYGFPLTIYFLSGWLGKNVPGVDLLSHNAGHLLELLFGWGGDPHLGPFHILSYLFIGGGFWLLSSAWPVLYEAQRQGRLAHTGIYARVRHPQYIAFVLIMFGFLLQWPTLLTLLMFPVLVLMYARLAHNEEQESARRFGQAWQEYALRVPRFIPRWGARARS